MMTVLAHKAAAEIPPGTQIFGVPGLTTGAVMILTMLVGSILVRWVQGMAERKRADNEGVTVVSGATDKLVKNLSEQIDRLTASIERQDKKIAAQDETIISQGKHILIQDRRISELEGQLAEARLLADKISKDELGALRNAVQSDLSTLDVMKKDETK